MQNIITLIVAIFLIQGCKVKDNPIYKMEKEGSFENGMVISAHPLASQIGVDILRKGGNAVDAAIAVQFALAVTYPVAGNIGGGGFMVYREADGNLATLDYREKAPKAAYANMYLDEQGNVKEGLSTEGHLAAGVPGTVDGMWQAFQKYSKLKNWQILLEPSVILAKNGFAITANEAEDLNYTMHVFDRVNDYTTAFEKQENWKTGDILKQPELAETLNQIKENGREGFYSGKVAEAIVADSKTNGGVLTIDDLKSYQAEWRQGTIFTYKNYKIFSMPPPSSGGIALQQIMKSIEPFDVKKMGWQSPEYVHLLVEAERRAYADRATHLGDPDYYKVPMQMLMDSTYIVNRMRDYSANQATKSSEVKAGGKESDQTTHYCIVDKYGNAVSMTTTLNTGYGSKAVVKGAGFILNNEMDDFSVKPGVPNSYGLIGAEANKIEAGKRMLSSMTPTIVEKDRKLFLVVGTPGGSTIITSVLQTILNVIEFDMTPAQAVSAPRFHHQWLPDMIQVEENCLTNETRKKLKNLGHEVKDRGQIGRVEAIQIKKGKLLGGADPRGDDTVRGY